VLSMTELSLDDPVAALRWLDPVSDLPQAGDISEPGCRPFVRRTSPAFTVSSACAGGST
jgi:hypothetical protein